MEQFTVKIRKVRFWPFKKRCSSGRLRLRNTGYTKTTGARILIWHPMVIGVRKLRYRTGSNKQI